MAIRSFPYVSVDGDRKITATNEAERIDQIVDSGIIFDDPTSFECQVQTGTMNINVKPGSAIIKGHGVISDAIETVTISDSESAYSRIDLIVLESNTNTEYRKSYIKVIKGEGSETPHEPELSSGVAGISQIKLAKVLVPNSVLYLDTATITDLRAGCFGRHNHTIDQILNAKSLNGIIGEIIAFGGEVAPEGTLLCDGSEVSRSVYNDLFEVIGTIYGSGDGSTTFNVPNLKGRVPVGVDSSQTEFDTLGETGGDKNLQEHSHGMWGTSGTRNLYDGANTWQYQAINTSQPYSNASSTTGTGNSGNLQPYITLNYVIKY